MQNAAAAAAGFVAGRSRPDLDRDLMLQLALTKLVDIVGEAAKQLSAATRARFPRVPWTDAARMRDRLVHHYFGVDLCSGRR